MLTAPVTSLHCSYALLMEHVADFLAYFHRLIQQASKRYNVKFSSLQALAFTMIWKGEGTLPPAAAEIIRRVLAAIDQKSKEPRLIRTT